MRARRANRLAVLIVALSTLPFALSCGDNNNGDGTTGPNPPSDNAIVGTWNATSFTAEGTDLIAAGLTVSFNFANDGTYSYTVTGDTFGAFCTGNTACSDFGTYDTSNGTLTFDRGTSDQESVSYSISGSTLSVSGNIGGTAFTASFEKVS